MRRAEPAAKRWRASAIGSRPAESPLVLFENGADGFLIIVACFFGKNNFPLLAYAPVLGKKKVTFLSRALRRVRLLLLRTVVAERARALYLKTVQADAVGSHMHF